MSKQITYAIDFLIEDRNAAAWDRGRLVSLYFQGSEWSKINRQISAETFLSRFQIETLKARAMMSLRQARLWCCRPLGARSWSRCAQLF